MLVKLDILDLGMMLKSLIEGLAARRAARIKQDEIRGLSMMIASQKYTKWLSEVQDHYRETGEEPKEWHELADFILDTYKELSRMPVKDWNTPKTSPYNAI